MPNSSPSFFGSTTVVGYVCHDNSFAFHQLFGIFATKDEDLPIGILSFRDKIVRVELLHHIGPEKIDGTKKKKKKKKKFIVAKTSDIGERMAKDRNLCHVPEYSCNRDCSA